MEFRKKIPLYRREGSLFSLIYLPIATKLIIIVQYAQKMIGVEFQKIISNGRRDTAREFLCSPSKKSPSLLNDRNQTPVNYRARAASDKRGVS